MGPYQIICHKVSIEHLQPHLRVVSDEEECLVPDWFIPSLVLGGGSPVLSPNVYDAIGVLNGSSLTMLLIVSVLRVKTAC